MNDEKELEKLREALTKKEAAFVHCYIGEAHFNGTRAAEMAGYTGNRNVLCVTAHRLLKKPHIKAYVDQFLTENALSARETLARLAVIARATIDDVLADDPDQVWFDKTKAAKNGSIHQVKKLRYKKRIISTNVKEMDTPQGKMKIVERIFSEEFSLEMLPAIEALERLGKYHKLFSDRLDLKGNLSQDDVKIFMPHNFRD